LDDPSLRELGRKIKVIICDLDHTLLNSKKQISPKNLKAIRSAQDKGIFVTISSGRIFSMLKTYQHAIAINGPIITTNGAAIVDARNDEILWDQHINPAIAAKILNFAKEHNYDYSVLTGNECFFSPNSIRIERFHQYNTQAASRGLPTIPLIYLNGNQNVIGRNIYKILIDENQPEKFKKAFNFLKSVEGINFTCSEAGLLDMLPAGVNKGVGVRELRRILGLKKEEVCVFGDYTNDLPMFAEAGFPIAMENALNELKENALLVTGHHDDDGVAQAMYKYIL
jgi:Cof subfamily protein (haloacid dehalogenase superfamily)